MKLNVKALAIASAISGLFIAAPSFAHTGVQAGHIDELTTIDTNIAIGHGCEQANGTVKPIIAQSVVFPMAEYEAAVAAGTLDGFEINTIQSKDIFGIQAEKFTAAGNLYAFSGRGGPGLNPAQLGRVPFQVSAPNVDPLGGNCISEVHINLAVADICVTASPKIRAGKLNLWAPAVAGSAIIAQATANGVDGVGHGPHLVIHNHDYDPIACGDPATHILELSPTAAEIDDGLDINGYWMAP
jgi:hypothetical protein